MGLWGKNREKHKALFKQQLSNKGTPDDAHSMIIELKVAHLPTLKRAKLCGFIFLLRFNVFNDCIKGLVCNIEKFKNISHETKINCMKASSNSNPAHLC